MISCWLEAWKPVLPQLLDPASAPAPQLFPTLPHSAPPSNTLVLPSVCQPWILPTLFTCHCLKLPYLIITLATTAPSPSIPSPSSPWVFPCIYDFLKPMQIVGAYYLEPP